MKSDEQASRLNPSEQAGGSQAKILDAAESLFAGSGFAATSMRAIAERAGVVQSLVHYHFGTKEKLFQEIFARRSGEMNAARLAKLEGFDGEHGGLDELLEIFLRPTVELGRDYARGSSHFSRLILAVAVSEDARDKNLITDNFDPFAQRLIPALRSLLPGLTEETAVWGYLFALGVAMTMMAPTARANRLSGGVCNDADTEAVLKHVICFAASGLRALSQMPPGPKRPRGARRVKNGIDKTPTR